MTIDEILNLFNVSDDISIEELRGVLVRIYDEIKTYNETTSEEITRLNNVISDRDTTIENLTNDLNTVRSENSRLYKERTYTAIEEKKEEVEEDYNKLIESIEV